MLFLKSEVWVSYAWMIMPLSREIVLTLPDYRQQMVASSLNSTDVVEDDRRITGGSWNK
jgi:hypothetical protein